MKKTLLFSLAAILLSCNSTEREVSKGAMQYIMAMSEYNISAARAYATEETQHTTLDFMESNIMPTIDPDYIAQNTPAKISIDSVVFDSDTSATVYFRKTTPIQTKTPANVAMRLRDGQWLAHQIVDFTIRMGTHPSLPEE